MYLTQEHNLKFHKLRAVISLFPPIERLERIISRLMAIGFVLLTFGLGLGAYYLKQQHGVFFTGDLKIVWSAFVTVKAAVPVLAPKLLSPANAAATPLG